MLLSHFFFSLQKVHLACEDFDLVCFLSLWDGGPAAPENILGVEPDEKEMDVSLPVTYYWDSPYTEAIQGEAPANINPIGLCKHKEGPKTVSSRERLLPCDKLS